jgi:predicted nucleic acid-binding protein
MPKPKRAAKKTANAFVLDASVTLAWYFQDEADPYADDVARQLPATQAIVPSIWPLEVANAVLTGERRKRGTAATAAQWIGYLTSLPITVDDPTVGRVFGDILALARTHDLSAYDASYLELATRSGLPLATLDDPLRAAAAAIGVAIYQP